MKKSLLLLLFAVGVLSSCKQQVSYDMSQPLPVDPNYRIGTLDNGLTYYIRNNNEPKDLANFYIIQKVGALLEQDSQNGLAHFLEHMAFNGTTNFPDKRIIKMLEENGVAFGHDINAYTGLDRTVYNLSNIPVANEVLLDSCLLVLHDWSGSLSLHDAEIDAERGVITEEWRTRNSASTRIGNQTRPVMFEGSQYAIRDVIGDMKVVNGFKYQELRDYYHKWYRPDLQAIAVIGAIDVDAMEQKIIELFSKIPAAVDPTPLPEFPLQSHDDIKFVLATDKDATNSSVSIYSVNEDRAPEVITNGYIKELYINSFYNSLLSQRISEKVREGSDYLNGGSAGYGGYVKNYSCYSISASAKPNMEEQAIEEVYTEVERARRFGFNQSELDRIKASTLNSLDNSYQQKDKVSNETYSKEIIDMFVDNGVAVDIEYYNPLVKYIIDQITIEEINEAASNLVTKNNMVIVITGPSQGVEHANKEAILSAMDRVERSTTLEPYYDEAAGLELINEELKGSKVKDVEKMEIFDAEKWTLANGVKVLFAKADENKNTIHLTATSDGGNSLVKEEDLLASSITGDIVGSFGMGDMDPTLFRKFMAGKTAGISIGISSLGESVGGASNTKDFELMLQMVYLAFENPRFDQTQFDNIISRSATAMDMSKGTSTQIMKDSVTRIMSNYNNRRQIYTGDDLRAVKLDDIERIYKDRIQNAKDFTFYIVGDIDKDVAQPLIEKYIGSISTNDRIEEWVDHNITIAEGLTERRVPIAFQTPKAMFINQNVNTYEDYSRKLHYEARILNDILTQRYTTSIREAEGGSYGVSVNVSVSRRPRKTISTLVQFECDPNKVDRLKELVFEEFDTIKANGVTSEEISGVVKTLIKNLEKSSHSNSFVLQSIQSKHKYDLDIYDLEKENAILNSITTEDIKRLANDIFNQSTDELIIIFDTKK